ncbi:unnamed protein product, partial [Chrysoparadoxa australica]
MQRDRDQHLSSLRDIPGREPCWVRAQIPVTGRLLIQQAKSIINNVQYAKKYGGRFVLRLDDTSKNCEAQFDEGILHDVGMLDVSVDQVSHSSDFFGYCQQHAEKMLLNGWAYMDGTPIAQINRDRERGLASPFRDTPASRNIARFHALLRGDPGADAYCLRAHTREDIKLVHLSMRDPILFIAGKEHYRMGSTYAAYPTSSFCTPIADSYEGITHALRTNDAPAVTGMTTSGRPILVENTRDGQDWTAMEDYPSFELYAWLQSVLQLRGAALYNSNGLQLSHTVGRGQVSKLLDANLLEGWDDPRLPTIIGLERRGLSLSILKSFLYSTGGRQMAQLSWKSLWAANKRYWEQHAARYMAIDDSDYVEVVITEVPRGFVPISVPQHPRNGELGYRTMYASHSILIERFDAAEVREGEMVTLLRWTSVVIREVLRNSHGAVVLIRAEYIPVFEFLKKKRAVTWLANCADLVPLRVIKYGDLLGKPYLEKGDNPVRFFNYNSCSTESLLGDPELRKVPIGQVIQLERRGFFRIDQPNTSPTEPMVLIMVPFRKGKERSRKGKGDGGRFSVPS